MIFVNNYRSTNVFFSLIDKYILYIKSSICALFQTIFESNIFFQNLSLNVISIFSFKKNVRFDENCYVIKKQLFLCLTFAMTNYKIQNLILNRDVLNLIHFFSNQKGRRVKQLKKMKKHKKFCSIYVQFSRFRKFENLRLIKKMFFQNLTNKSHSLFLKKTKRLTIFNVQTLIKWTKKFEQNWKTNCFLLI